jgi:hypothetical protein
MDQKKKWFRYVNQRLGEVSDEENELGSAEDLKNCQEGREEIPVCQVGNELRSLRDLRDCHEDSQGISHCQLGNEMRSLRDLKTARRAVEASQIARWAEMSIRDYLKVSWTRR